MEGMQFCYPRPHWFAQALGSPYVESWIKASRQPYWYRPATLAVLAPFDHRSIDSGTGERADVDKMRAARLVHEMALFTRAHGVSPGVAEVYWSAGLTALDEPALRAVHDAMTQYFDVEANAGFTARAALSSSWQGALLPVLRECGVTTLHTGVTPAHADLSASIEPFIDAARSNGFRSIAVDLPIDQPHVSAETVRDWAAALCLCRPSRIFLTRRGSEPAIRPSKGLDDADLRLQRIWQALFATLIAAGYEHIAHDAFALHADELANAKRLATLVPRCYGYSTCASHASIAIGQGAVGNAGPMQYQNCRDPVSYAAMLDREALPIERGLLTSPNDLARRAIMASLLTNFAVDVEAIEQCYWIDFRAVFRPELVALEPLERDGFVEIDTKQLRLTPIGRFACGRVANLFDRYSQPLERARPEQDGA